MTKKGEAEMCKGWNLPSSMAHIPNVLEAVCLSKVYGLTQSSKFLHDNHALVSDQEAHSLRFTKIVMSRRCSMLRGTSLAYQGSTTIVAT